MRTVLIVDDERDMVELMTMALDDGTVEPLAAYGGEQALEVVREDHPDLVLADVVMPRIDGLELCRAIKSDPESARTPVVLMTAMLGVDRSECGAEALLIKPFSIDDLTRTVHAFL